MGEYQWVEDQEEGNMYAMNLEVEGHFQGTEEIRVEVEEEVILPLDSQVLMVKQTQVVWVWLEGEGQAGQQQRYRRAAPRFSGLWASPGADARDSQPEMLRIARC